MIEIGPEGLPTVRCQAGAPAARMNVAALLQLEQAALLEEDLLRAGLPLDRDFKNFEPNGLMLNLLLGA